MQATNFTKPLLFQLIGQWKFNRHIDNGMNVQGDAAFQTRNTCSLLYTETGVLTTAAGQKLEAHQSYVFTESNDGFDVFFNEEPLRLFHSIVLQPFNQGFCGQANHLCGSDLYESQYEFFTPCHFAISHKVKGPKKNYLSVTHFRRHGV